MYERYEDTNRGSRSRQSSRSGRSGRSSSSRSRRNRRDSGRSRDNTLYRDPDRAHNQRRRAQTGASGARRSGRQAPRRRGIPALTALVAVLLSVAISILGTRCAMQPKIDAAEQAKKEANNEVASLKSQVASLEEAVKKAELKNAGVDSPWTESGKFTSGDDTLDKDVKTFCDKNCGNSKDVNEAALEVYKAIAWSEYVERDDAQDPKGENWRIEYAKKYYDHDCTGNCYEYATFLSYCLQYMGYEDAIAQACIVELQSGDWGDHGLVFVTNTDGSKCLCDTSYGVNGWMVAASSYNVEIKDVASES